MSNLELSYDFIDPQLDWACVEPGEEEPMGRQTGEDGLAQHHLGKTG